MAMNLSCCGPTGPSCSGCRDISDLSASAPSTIQAVISGTTLCTTCVEISGPLGGFGSNHYYGKVISGTLDGTYCLTYFSGGTQCIWTATLPDPIVVAVYFGNCFTFNQNITISKIKCIAARSSTIVSGYAADQYPQGWPATADSGTTPLVQPMNLLVTLDTPIAFGAQITLFSGIMTGYPNCANGTISNLATTCGTVEWWWQGINASTGQGHRGNLATGGTCTLTMNGC